MSMDISWNTLESVFLGVCGAHLVATAALSVVARAGRPSNMVAGGDRDVYELAAIHGGALCVLTAAAARLHAAGCLALSDGSVVTSWRLQGDVAPVERELYEAVDLAPGMTAHSLPGALRRGPACARIDASLSEAGLLPGPWVSWSLRSLERAAWAYSPLLLLALLAGGAPAAGELGGQAVPWDVLGLGLLMPVAVTAAIRRSGPGTRAGDALLERHRDRVRHLAEGPVADRDLALAVALFGSEPLRTTYPEFATAWGILSPEEVQLQAAMLG